MTTTDIFDWSAVAGSWGTQRHQVETMKRELTSELLAGLRLAAGASVLELGAGTGELALRLADAVGPDGHILTSDVASGMLALIRETTSGHPEIDAALIDADRIDQPAASFDGVAFRMGLMLLAEPSVALAECRRVLRPGGRLAVAVWGAPQHNPWLISVGMSAGLHGVVSGGLPTEPGGVFSLSDPVELQQLVEGAGFSEVSVKSVATSSHYATAAEHFDSVAALAGPLQVALAAASAETMAAVRATSAEIIAEYRTDDGYVIPGQALLAVASA